MKERTLEKLSKAEIELDQTQTKMIMRNVREILEKATTQWLAAKYDQSHTVIYLTDKGYHFKKIRGEPILDEDNIEDRIANCYLMPENRRERIYKTIYSDEMGISLSSSHVEP